MPPAKARAVSPPWQGQAGAASSVTTSGQEDARCPPVGIYLFEVNDFYLGT